MLKWAEVSLEENSPRLSRLSEVWKVLGYPNEFTHVETSGGQFNSSLESALEKFDALRIGHGLGELAYGHFKHHSDKVRFLSSGDSILKKGDKWWLQSATYEATIKTLTEVGEDLDQEASVLVVGTGTAAKAIIAAVMKFGFSEINICSQFDDHVIELTGELRRKYFGVKFNNVPRSQLISLVGNNSLVVNTTPVLESNELIEELSYLNFLKRPGVVMDLSLDPVETPLIKEAKTVGARAILGPRFADYTDQFWSQWVLGDGLDADLLLEKLGQA